jgi:hypothetical protein
LEEKIPTNNERRNTQGLVSLVSPALLVLSYDYYIEGSDSEAGQVDA